MSDDKKLLQIKKLELHNYRRFEKLAIDFDEKLTVLVAKNGCGKTAVLDAVAIALGPFVGAFDTVQSAQFHPSDVRRKLLESSAGMRESEKQFPVKMFADGIIDGTLEKWERMLSGDKSHTTYGGSRPLINFGNHLQKQVRIASVPVALPLISYYGTGRLWGDMRFFKKRKENLSRTAGYMLCLSGMSSYKIFAEWFERFHRAAFEEQDNPLQLEKIQASLQAFKTAVNAIIEPLDWKNIDFKVSKGGIIMEQASTGITLPVDWLSDGVRNIVALTADIAHRAIRLNSHLPAHEAIRTTQGIVLIDEIDMHLHPKWQQTILPSLTRAFPSIQFIVTTHSPQVITSVHKKHIKIINEDGALSDIADDMGTLGSESNRVLAEIFAVPPRPPVQEEKLTQYLELVEKRQHNTNEAIKLLNELRDELGTGDKDLQYAAMRIKQLDYFAEKNEENH